MKMPLAIYSAIGQQENTFAATWVKNREDVSSCCKQKTVKVTSAYISELKSLLHHSLVNQQIIICVFVNWLFLLMSFI